MVQDLSRFFNAVNDDPNEDPLVKDLFNRGDTEARRAGTGIEKALSSRGFGGSTFVDPLKAQASSVARTPFIRQANQAANTISQQNSANFFKALNIQEQRDKFEKQKQQNLLFSVLGNLGGIAGAFNPLLGGISGLFGGQSEGSLLGEQLAAQSSGSASNAFDLNQGKNFVFGGGQ